MFLAGKSKMEGERMTFSRKQTGTLCMRRLFLVSTPTIACLALANDDQKNDLSIDTRSSGTSDVVFIPHAYGERGSV